MTGANAGSRGVIRPVPATPGGGSAMAGWLLVLAAVLLPVLLVAQWVDDLVADRQQYQAVASSLAGGSLADAVESRIADDVMDRLALEAAPRSRLAALAAVLDVSPAVRADPVRQRARLIAAVRTQVLAQVGDVLARQREPRRWVGVAIGLQGQVITLVREPSRAQARARAGKVALRVDVQTALAPGRAMLAQVGLPPRVVLPPVTLSLSSVDPDRFERARRVFWVAHEARRVLPAVCVLLAGAGVALARRKWRAIAVACLLGTVPLLAAWLVVRAGREAAPDVRTGSAFLDALVEAVAGAPATALNDSFRITVVALVGVGLAAMLLAGSVGRFGSTSWMPPVVGYVPPRPRPGVRPDGRGPRSSLTRPGTPPRTRPGSPPGSPPGARPALPGRTGAARGR